MQRRRVPSKRSETEELMEKERREVQERVHWRTDVRHRREDVLTATLDAKTYRVADGRRPVLIEDDDDKKLLDDPDATLRQRSRS